jgi:hypothetical protein
MLVSWRRLRVCSDLLSQAADVRTADWQAGMNFGIHSIADNATRADIGKRVRRSLCPGFNVRILPVVQPIDHVIGQRAKDANREPGP